MADPLELAQSGTPGAVLDPTQNAAPPASNDPLELSAQPSSGVSAPESKPPGSLTGLVKQYNQATNTGGSGKMTYQFGAPKQNDLAAAARMISAGLAPFQLPQDLLFANIKTFQDLMLNPGSVAESMAKQSEAQGTGSGRAGVKQILSNSMFSPQFRKNFAGKEDVLTHLLEYIPFQPLSAHGPERQVSGADLLAGMGVQNPATLKWGGIGLDVGLDPLVAVPMVEGFGMALKGAGKAAEAASIATKSARAASVGGKMAEVGQKIAETARVAEPFTSPIAGPILTAKAVLPAQVTDAMTNAWARVGRSIMNLPAGNSEFTVGDMLAPMSRALNAKLGTKITRGPAGEFTDVGVGGKIRLADKLGQQAAQDVQTTAVQGLKDLHNLLGKSENRWWSGVMEAVTKHARVGPTVNYIPDKTVRDTILNMVYEGTKGGEGSSGWAMNVARRNTTPAVEDLMGKAAGEMAAKTPLARQAESLQSRLQGAFGAEAQMTADQAFHQKILHVRKVAEGKGVNPDQAEAVLRQATHITQMSDASIGMSLSMVQPISENFLRATTKAGMTADEGAAAWSDVLRRGANGEDIYKLDSIMLNGQATPLSSIVGGEKTTVGDLLGAETSFAKLNMNAFAKGLQDGHLRRAYGMFYTPGDMNALVGAFNDGKIVPSNMIDEQNIAKHLADQGLGPEGKLVQDYLQGTTGASGAERGFLVKQSDIAEMLKQAGVAPARIKQTLQQIVASAHGPGYQDFLRTVNAAAENYSKPVATPVPSGAGGSRAFLSQRENFLQNNVEKAQGTLTKQAAKAGEDISDPAVQARVAQQAQQMGQEEAQRQLEALGELGNPYISLHQQAVHAGNVLAPQEYLNRTYQLATDNGFAIRGPAFPDMNAPVKSGMEFVHIPDNQGNRNGVGAFAGTWVHPAVKTDIERTLLTRDSGWTSYNHLRSLVTGGYLTGPPVTVKNVLSGFVNTAQMGINPVLHMFHFGTAWRDLERAAKGKVIPDLELYRSLEPLQMSRMSQASGLADDMANMARKIAIGELDAPNAFKTISVKYRNFLNKPFGIPFAGLNFFQQSENAMRFSAFRSARAMGMDTQTAANAARYSVFDYSELPYSLRGLRDTGLVLFPGFSYFLKGRIIDAAIRHPSVLSVSDRLPAAITNAVAPDQRYQIYANLPDWMKKDHPAPAFTTVDPSGAMVAHMMPIGQMVPNNAFEGGLGSLVSPFTDSVANAGVLNSPLNLVAGWASGTGKPMIGAQYGGQVFEPGRGKFTQTMQSLGYLWNNLAPSVLRKAASYTAGKGWSGWASDLVQASKHYIDKSSVPMPLGIAQTHFSLAEQQSKKASRGFVDSVISALVATTTPVTLSGPLANAPRNMAAAKTQLDAEVATWKNEAMKEKAAIDRAASQNMDAAQRVHEQRYQDALKRIGDLQQRFKDQWQPVIDELRKAR